MLDIIYILVSMLVNRKQTSINRKKKKSNNNKRHKRYSSLGAVFDKHIKCEFQDHDVDATMKTMFRESYVHHVPGGVVYDAVYDV